MKPRTNRAIERSAFASIEPQTTTPLTAQWLDLRLTSAIRLMLATSALLAFIIDPAQATRDPHLSGVLFGCFTIYCGVFLVLAFYRNDLIPSQIMHWFDMIWFQFLVYLTGGGASIFFTFFFFSILVASFGWGYKSGLRLTLATTIIFTVLSLQQAGWDQANKVMLRSIALLVLGFMISRWGGFRMSLRNRLQLLKDVTVVSNARFGTDRTITSILETLRGFFDADACLLLIRPNPERDADYQIYRIRRGVLSTGSSTPHISARDARLFILPSSNHAMVYRQPRERLTLIDINTKEASKVDPATGDRIANALEATSYMSVPVRNRNLVMGRLYVVGGPEHYDHSAVEVVIQLLDHVTPLIENIRLIDTLASYSAEEERRRIARDIHDSVIQPYIGLQLGIAAVAQKLRAGNMDVINDVEELSDLTNQELAALRGYVWS